MNNIVKKIDDLRSEISFINFSEHLTSEDYENIRKKEKEIEELKKLVSGELFAVMLTHKRYNYSFYLTAHSSLCCSDEPTWFDSKEEAEEYLNKAELNQDNYDIEIVKKVFK